MRPPRRAATWLRLHGGVAAALAIGFLVGVGAGLALAGSGLVALAAVALAILTAGATGLVQEVMGSVGKRGLALVSGRAPGNRRLEAAAFGQTRVMAHVGGQQYERERWVDLHELDHRGFFYGVAESPTYIPLYGNGLVEIPVIEIDLSDRSGVGHGHLTQEASARIDPVIAELRDENAAEGRAFSEGNLARLLTWQPPVSASTALKIRAEPVNHQRYVAATTILRRDDGSLRETFGVSARVFDNPIVHGALGVEIAVITSDGKLVLGHRGTAGNDYRNQIVVSFGEGIDPRLDALPSEPSRVDPHRVVTRGMQEEFGLEIDGRETVFLALGSEVTRMDPDLLGYIRIPHTASALQGSLLAGRARDRWETQTVTFVDFTPASVADLLGGPLRRSLTPPTAMNLVFALSHIFGEAETQRSLAR